MKYVHLLQLEFAALGVGLLLLAIVFVTSRIARSVLPGGRSKLRAHVADIPVGRPSLPHAQSPVRRETAGTAPIQPPASHTARAESLPAFTGSPVEDEAHLTGKCICGAWRLQGSCMDAARYCLACNRVLVVDRRGQFAVVDVRAWQRFAEMKELSFGGRA